MATSNHVLGLFRPPTQEDCEEAISCALLRVRSTGVTREELANALDCSPNTIDNASNCKSMLGFKHIALLMLNYPDVRSMIEPLWTLSTKHEPTIDERIERIERDLNAIRKVAVDCEGRS
jgi:hypothetical protein